MIREYYEKHADKIKKYVPIIIILVAVLSMARSAYGLIRMVWDTGRQSYLVNERNTAERLVETETFRTELEIVGKEMLSVEVRVSVGESPKGVLIWWMEDSHGKQVISKQEQEISQVLTEDRQRLSLRVPKGSLEQGKTYTLVTEFTGGRELSVLAGGKGLALVQYFSFRHQVLFTVIILLCSGTGLFILALIYKKGLKIRWYVVLSLFAGLMTVFFIPPMSKDDEFRHFVRVYTLAKGQNTIELSRVTPEDYGVLSNAADGLDYITSVPGEVNELRLLDFYVNFNDNSYHAERNQSLCLDKLLTLLGKEPPWEEVRVSCVGTVTKGMESYWPQVIPVWIGMHLGTRPVVWYYLARMGQMLTGVLLGALALKLAPKYKDMIWLLSFIPNVIALKSSCNSDGLLIAEMMLLVAVVLWIRETGSDILSKKALWADAAFLILSYGITKMKMPCFLFCTAVLFVLKKENLGKIIRCWKNHWRILAPCAAGAAVLAGIWVAFGGGLQFFLSKLYSFVPEWHVGYILEHPGYIVRLFGHEFYNQLRGLYYALNGANKIPYAMALIVSLLLCKREMPQWKRLLFAASFGIMVLTIILVGYTFTPPDYGSIWGLSFRYLLPFLPMAALAAPWGTERSQNAARTAYPTIIVVVVTVTSISWLVGMNTM